MNDTFRKLDNLTLGECFSPFHYVSKFRQIVNELQSFSSGMKLDENWLIYRFHTNLGTKFSSSFERYYQDHDPFNKQGEAKHFFSSAIQYFLNTARNLGSETPIIKSGSGFICFHAFAAFFIALNLPANQSSIQTGAKPGTNEARVITLTKTVNYYTHCKQDYQIEAECHDKHPQLRDSKPKSTKPQTKRLRGGKKSDKHTTDNAHGAFFVQSDRVSFLSSPLELALSKIWIWDSGTSQHSSHNRSLFDNFKLLPNQSPVKGLGGEVIPLGISSIRVS